jgi:hypothetical protein
MDEQNLVQNLDSSFGICLEANDGILSNSDNLSYQILYTL